MTLILTALLLAAPAHADVVMQPNITCPRGTVAKNNHGSWWCAPAECNDECSSGCPELSLCVETREEPCGGLRPDTGDCSFTLREAFGRCAADGSCERGVCETADFCARSSQGCGCSTATSGGALIALFGLTLLAIGRRPRAR